MSVDDQDHSFGPHKRLRHAHEFRHVFDSKLSVADATLVVYGARRTEPAPCGRLGLSVSRKVGNAVVRNRWKRHIREAFRRHPSQYHGWDVVVIPRRGVPCDHLQIERSLNHLMQRLQRKHQRRG